MKPRIIGNEKGQSLVIIGLGLIAFVAMLALVLDGANAYAAKRQAQNAADAGALAGAQVMCKELNEGLGEDQAIAYADLNGADLSKTTAEGSLSSATMIVHAAVTKKTFFAGVIGFTEVSPVAVAKAACQNPGVGVLPVAWSCREDVTGYLDCAQDYGPCRNGDKYDDPDPYETDDPYGLNCTYVLMDSVKVKDKSCKDPDDPNCYLENDLVCSPQVEDSPGHCSPSEDPLDAGKIDCDLDNDCSDELMTGGARSWLDLDGSGGGANELKDWISGKVDPPDLEKHYWVPEESGVATSIFHTTAEYLVGDIAILPVFNKVCNGLPYIEVSTAAGEGIDQCSYWTGDNQDLITSSTLNFHIISFSAFHVTCVQTGKNKVTAETGYFLDKNDKDCYGHAEAVSQNLIDENDKTIEGYFIREDVGGYGSGGEFFDTGTFTVVLVPYP